MILNPNLLVSVSQGDDDLELNQMVETFRLSKSVKYQGMLLTALFLVALAGYSSVFFLDDPAKHGFKGKHSVAVVGGLGLVVFGTMLLLSIYVWAAYYVEQFAMSGTHLRVRSIFQNHEFDVSELECLAWRPRPLCGSIVFHVAGSKSRVDLYGYAKEDRLRIIQALHQRVPVSRQNGWPEFCHLVALPLRDGLPPVMRSDPSVQCLTVTRTRYDRMAAVVFPLAILVGITLWLSLNLWQPLALPLPVIAAWLLLRFNVPTTGRSEVRLTTSAEGRALLVGWSAIVSMPLLVVGLGFCGVEKSIACLTGCVIMGGVFLSMLYRLYKADKQRRQAQQRAAKLATEQWQH